ncbi:unnamed protein product [Enterobius vermicularis]|uniref:Saposin B-type domain-containing protein n=1 Tax=Enterobius vermicularis TaxID=51028 RepID=A0A0N4VML6_ENTVE|nr:unnamed protein product [Enterobius vermicularis]
MLKLWLLATMIVLAYGESISCGLCKSTLTHVIDKLQSTPGALKELGSSMSVSCDEVPNKEARVDCRKLMKDHFNDLFGSFVNNDNVKPSAMCVKLGYCSS